MVMKKFLVALAILTAGLSSAPYPAQAVVSNTTVSTTTGYGNGSNTSFTITFDFRANTWINVVEVDTSVSPATSTTISQGVGASKFTITGGNPGTTVVMGTAPTTSQYLIITRNIPLTQGVVLNPASIFPYGGLSQQLDQVTLTLQNLNANIGGSSGGSGGSSGSLPNPGAAYDFIAWDSSGASTINATTAYDSGQTTFQSGDILKFTGTGWGTYLFNAANLMQTLNSGTSPLGPGAGGTGVVNGGTFTWGSNPITFTTTGTTGLTLPTSGSLIAGTTDNNNTANTIVKRDASGNFSAGTVTAALVGNVTGNVAGNVTGNTSGTAANVTGIVAYGNGGTNQTSRQSAINGLLAGTGPSGTFARWDGANVTLDALHIGDVPTGFSRTKLAMGTPNTLVMNDGSGNLFDLAGGSAGNCVEFNGTAWVSAPCLNGSPLVGVTYWGTDTGTANAKVVTTSQSPGGYASGVLVTFEPVVTNTGATTINLDGLGVVNLMKLVGGTPTALVAGDVAASSLVLATYDGTEFIVTSGLQNAYLSGAQFSGLTASQAVVTDGSKNLASLAYSATGGTSNLVSRDTNGNTRSNNVGSAATAVTAAAGTTVLTAASTRYQVLQGSGVQTFQLPDATTLFVGARYEFNNNSTGNLSVVNAGSGAVATVVPGASVIVICISSATSNGAWDYHFEMPSNAAYGTAGLTVTGTLNSSALTASQAVVSDSSKNLASLPYATTNTATSLVERDSSGNFAAGTITATLTGTATNATNGATVSTSTNASFFPLFAASSSNSNQPFNLGTGLTFNPSTNLLALASGGLFQSTNGSETVQVGMSGSTRFTMNNSSHASSTFFSFAPSTDFMGFGVGTFSNDYQLSTNLSSSDTTPTTGLVPGATIPVFNIHNTGTTANDYGALIFTSGSTDKVTSAVVGVTEVHTAASETGHLEVLVNNSGTKARAMKIAADKTVTMDGYTAGAAVFDSAGKISATAPGTAGNVLTSDGTTWTSAAAAVANDPQQLTNLGFSVTASTTLVIALKQADGSTDPGSGASVVTASFRSATTTSGAYAQKSFTAATSLTLAAADSIGCTNAVTCMLYFYLVKDTTSEICASQTLFDDRAVQSASALTGSADTDGTKMWCTNAHTSVPVRLIGKETATWSNPNWGSAANAALMVGNRAPRSEVFVTASPGYGSTNTKIARWTTIKKNTGTAITLAQSSTNGDTFTINETGVYAMALAWGINGATGNFGISVNSTELTTGIVSISESNRLFITNEAVASTRVVGAITTNLNQGDVIRVHTDGQAAFNGDTNERFNIVKVSD